MNFLFHRHTDEDSVTIHCDEALPHNTPDILPDEGDTEREKAEKQLLAHHTRGGHLLQRAQVNESWVQEPYRNLLSIRGVTAVSMIDCYQVVVHKGSIFTWEQILAKVPSAIADGIKGEIVAEVLDEPCPTCYGKQPKSVRKSNRKGKASTEEFRKLNESELNQLAEMVLGAAEKIGAYCCCVVEQDGGALSVLRLPDDIEMDGGLPKLASAAASLGYETWLNMREKKGELAEVENKEHDEPAPAADAATDVTTEEEPAEEASAEEPDATSDDVVEPK